MSFSMKIEEECRKSPIWPAPLFCLKVLSGSSEAEEENDPDGPFAFRRKAGCQYYAVSAIPSLH